MLKKLILISSIGIQGSLMAGIQCEGAKIYLMPSKLPMAGYAKLSATDKKDISIVKVESNSFKSVEIHEMVEKKGMMSMQKMEVLKISKDRPVEFKMGGIHLMAIGANSPLKVGQKVGINFITNEKKSLLCNFDIVRH